MNVFENQVADGFKNQVSEGVNFYLQWADPWGASTNDYDLLPIDDNDEIIDSSTSIQDGTQDPIEYISNLPDSNLVMVRPHGAGNRFLPHFAFDGARRPNRDIDLDGVGIQPMGLWSDSETLRVSSFRNTTLHAFDVTGLRSSASASWSPIARVENTIEPLNDEMSNDVAISIPDDVLRTKLELIFDKVPGENIDLRNIASLTSLNLRGAGVSDLRGLEHAVNLAGLDLGLNEIVHLDLLDSLPKLETLNLGVCRTDTHQ